MQASKYKADLKSTIRLAVSGIIPIGSAGEAIISSEEVDIIAQLCVMGTVPTGEEDPKGLVRRLSDRLINSFAMNFDRLQKNPVSAPVVQLFFVEWCYRHNHLNDDWKWDWDTTEEGHVSYSSKKPLVELLNDIMRTC